jgi:hypothetical protein
MEIMQAGESIKSAIQKSENSPESTSGMMELSFKFGAIVTELMNKENTVMQKSVVFENSEFIGIQESSYRIDYGDGSYLHIVVFFHTFEDEPIDGSIHIDEHAEDGRKHDGLVYYYQGGQLARFVFDDSQDNEPNYNHFSIHELHKSLIELDEQCVYGGEEEKTEAQAIKDSMEETILLESYKEEIDPDYIPATISELETLHTMIKFAEPFTVPSNEDDN